MTPRRAIIGLLLAAVGGVAGCQTARAPFVAHQAAADPPATPPPPAAAEPEGVRPAGFAQEVVPGEVAPDPPVLLPPPSTVPEEVPSVAPTALDGAPADAPTSLAVVASVRAHFPLIRQAMASRIIASGEALSASGAFDHKLSGYNNIQPLDFYENHWYKWGVERDTMWGGKVGAGYRLGRGSFEPWYKERETNDGGEFGLKVSAPIIRDMAIDANRAELWRAQLERGRVEPIVRSQVIVAVRDGVAAYWEWVAAAANLRVAESVLDLGVNRQGFIQRQFDLGKKARIDLTDNQRIIVQRRAKQIDARRKLQQTAVKLSLFLRTPNGQPLMLGEGVSAPEFPEVAPPDEASLAADVEFAVANRPELAELGFVRRQLNIAYRQACNETLPDIDAGLFAGQDVGNPTSSNDKSDFELEATLTVSVPLERRKAVGKVRQIRGKLAQVRAKTQFAAEKVAAEVGIARAALIAAAERVTQTREGVRLADEMQAAEQRRYERGASSLFELNLREKQAADAAVELVTAQLDYFIARADYIAALGLDSSEIDAQE